MEALACLALLHVNHDQKWLFEGASAPNRGRVCIACLLEKLRIDNELAVKRKVVINELQAIFSANSKHVSNLLTNNISIAIYAIEILLDLTSVSDERLVASSVECALQITRLLKTDDSVICTFENVVNWISNRGLAFRRWSLYLIGQLLAWHPQCTGHISTHGPFVDIVNSALRFPDDNVKSVAIFVLVHLVTGVGWTSCLLNKPLPEEIINVLNSAQSKELRTNAMALVRLMVSDDGLLKMLFAVKGDGCTFTLVLKKMLQMKDCDQQVACVQCIDHIVSNGPYADLLLDYDIAELLFEALCDIDDLLVQSILTCCLTFARSTDKFVTDHMVYGMDSIIRIIERSIGNMRQHILTLALEILTETIRQHKMSLHNTIVMTPSDVTQLLNILSNSAVYPDHLTAAWAMRLSSLLLNKDTLTAPIPVQNVVDLLDTCHNVLLSFFPLASISCSPLPYSDKSKILLQLLEAALCVFNAATKLYEDCLQDPLTWSETYGDSEVSASPLSIIIVVHRVIKVMQNTFVPLMMANNDYLKWKEVFLTFFTIVTNILSMDLDKIKHDLTMQLAQCGMLRTVFDSSAVSGQNLNYNLNTHDDHVDCIGIRNAFVVSMLLALHTAENVDFDQKELTLTFQLGLQHIFGNRKEFNKIFQHTWLISNSYNDVPGYVAAQITISALCYYSTINNTVFIPSSKLLPAICNFFTTNSINLQRQQTNSIWKYLLFLFAHSSVDFMEENPDYLTSPAYQDGLSNLVDNIQCVKDVRAILNFDEKIFKWIFMFSKTASAFGSHIIINWLMRNLTEDDNSDCKLSLDCIDHQNFQEEIFIQQLMRISFGDEENDDLIGGHASTALNSYFNCKPHSLKNPVLHTIFHSLLRQMTNSEKLNRLLIIICQWLKVNCEDEDQNRLKILHKVSSIMFKYEDVTLQCFNCFNASLSPTNKDTTMLNFLISDHNIIKNMEKLCSYQAKNNGNLALASWALLANLITSQTSLTRAKRASTMKNVIKLSWVDLEMAMKSNNPSISLNAINIIKLLIEKKLQFPFFPVLQCETVPTVIRAIFITLLEAMTKNCGNEEIVQTILDCILDLFSLATIEEPKLVSYLMGQMWLPLAIKIQLQRGGQIHILQFINELFEFAEFPLGLCAKELLHHLADSIKCCNKLPLATKYTHVISSIELKIRKPPYCDMLTPQQKDEIKSALTRCEGPSE